MSEQVQPPPNPFYRREYVWSMSGKGGVHISISAPGGFLPAGGEAEEIIEFIELVIKHIRRHASPPAPQPPESEVT